MNIHEGDISTVEITVDLEKGEWVKLEAIGNARVVIKYIRQNNDCSNILMKKHTNSDFCMCPECV